MNVQIPYRDYVVRRAIPYTVALAAIVVLIGAIAWRYGRAPAVAATILAAFVADYFFLEPKAHFGLLTFDDIVRIGVAVVASVVVIQFGHVARKRQLLLEKRKDLLQDVSPRIIQSLDSDSILDTVTEATLRVIDYQHFRLYRWDEAKERLVLAKSVARTAPYAGTDWHTITLGLGEGITGIAAQSRKPLLVPDASRDRRMVYPAGTEPIEESVISVPMVTGERLFGVLTLARLGAASLTMEDLRLMDSIAAQTALALANAEQYAEAQKTIRALTMIESLHAGDSSITDQEVARRILQSFVDLSQADLAAVRILQADGRYHVVATGGRNSAEEPPSIEPLPAAEVSWLADPKMSVYVADPRTDLKLPDWAQKATQRAGVMASVFLPMRAGQQFLGFTSLHWRRPRWFHPEQLGRLQLLAAQGAIAIDTRNALERERARSESLAELERARREFMQIASHELRTPLTVIRGYASMLEEGSLGQMPAPAQHALRTLLDKSTEMRTQVERMLLLARLEDGAVPPQMASLDLRKIVNDSIERVRPQVDLKHGEVAVDLSDGPLPVVGDPDRLATAVDNLLQNAVKFCEGPPKIEVLGGRQNGRVTLVIRDHGIGIADAAKTRLFEKFYRVNDPQLQNVGGTGIGLYLVRQVVEGHGGQVKVESQPGEGSAFEIDLPVASPETASSTLPTRGRGTASASSSKTP
jgi:signal transduction histidine kinase